MEKSNRLQKLTDEAKETKTNFGSLSGSDILEKLHDRLNKRSLHFDKTGKKYIGLDTGFEKFNDVTDGLQKEAFWVISGIPGCGKTTFLKQLVDQIAENNDDAYCLYISYEQSPYVLWNKTLSRLSGVEYKKVNRGLLGPEEWKTMVGDSATGMINWAGRLGVIGPGSSEFFEVDAKDLTVERLRDEVDKLKEKLPPEAHLVVALDYLQIIPSSGGLQDIRARVEKNVTDLKAMASEFRISVITLSSLSRGAYEKGGIAGAKETGLIEYSADVIMDLIVTTPESDRHNIPWECSLNINKNREGESDKGLYFGFNPEKASFRYENMGRRKSPPASKKNYRKETRDIPIHFDVDEL